MHIVIIGNGVAGMEAALAVRQRQEDWRISIVSEESDHFFSRTALMYVFCGQMAHGDIEPYERGLYERLRFERVRQRATGLDTAAKQVLLAGGEKLSYDRLLIACGSRPRPGIWPNSHVRGIGHFVTLQDLEWLEKEVYGPPGPAGRPSRPDAHLQVSAPDSPYAPRQVAAEKRGRLARKAVVVGGGLIGLEVVEILNQAGVEVHFLIMEEWYWPMAIDRAESTWVAELMQQQGVHVHLQTQVEQFLADEQGNVRAARTKDGREIECDIALITIGVLPNTEWLREADIELDERMQGIVVDAGLATSAAEVFAAGDCATVTWFNGARRPEQLWYTARAQGRIAARRLLGDEVEYQRGTFYNSAKFLDIEYTTAGLVNFGLEGEQEFFYEEKGPVRSTTRIVHQQGRVIGFNLLGRRWDHRRLVRWIEERRDLDYVLDHLHEASFDAELTPPLELPGRRAPKRTLFNRLFA